MKRNRKPVKVLPGDVRNFIAYPDFSGVSALVDVTVDGQRFTYAANFLGTEAKLWLVAPVSGSRLPSKIAAERARAAFEAALDEQTTVEYRKATRAFYAQPENAS